MTEPELGQMIRAREADLLDAEIVLLDNVRWALKDHPERAWETITKMIEGKAKSRNELRGGA